MTLTQWWQSLLTKLTKLNHKFSELNYDQNKDYNALIKIARLGMQLEAPSNSVFKLREIDEQIKAIETELGFQLTNPENGQVYHLPEPNSPAQVLLALTYYQSLLAFEDIRSSIPIIQHGVSIFGITKPGIEQNKPIVKQNAISYFEMISDYLNSNSELLLKELPKLVELKDNTIVEKCFSLIDTNDIEEKIAKRYVLDFKEIVETCEGESLLSFLTQLGKRLVEREDVLKKISICIRMINLLNEIPSQEQLISPYIEEGDELFEQFLLLCSESRRQYWQNKYRDEFIVLTPVSPNIPEPTGEASLTQSTLSYMSNGFSFVTSSISNIFSSVIPTSISTGFHNALSRHYTNIGGSAVAFKKKFSIPVKPVNPLLKELKTDVQSLISNLAASFSTPNEKIHADEFIEHSPDRIQELAQHASLLRTITDTDHAMQQFLSKHKIGLIKFSDWSIFGVISRIFASTPFLASLLNDTLRLTYEIDFLRKRLADIKLDFQANNNIESTQEAFEDSIKTLKSKSESISQTSRYPFAKELQRKNLQEAQALANEALSQTHRISQISQQP